jgi:hypothetical protein
MKINLLTVISLTIGIFLGACGPSTQIPTDTPSDFQTPLAGSSTATSRAPAEVSPTLPAPTITPGMSTGTVDPTVTVATSTPADLGTAQVIPTLNPYCRKGPGVLYDMVTFIYKGNSYDIVGRNRQNTWWLVKVSGVDPCWVGTENVTTKGAVAQVMIVPDPPIPDQPSLFVNDYVCISGAKSFGVLLNWAASQNAAGYRIYRDSELLTTVAGSATSYHDDAPMNVELVYELEAFNPNGVALRLQTNVPACR